MSSYTISHLKENLRGVLHSTDLDKVKNPYHLFGRKAKELLGKIDPVGTKRIGQITNAIHSDIYDYTAPDDLKADKIIDIYPQAGRTKADRFSQRYSQRFAAYKTRETFHVRDKDGTKILRMSASIETPKTIHSCENLTDNGTWAADGTGASNLTRDTLYYYDGAASLNFDLTAGQTTGYLENSTMSAVDLEDMENVGSLWARVYIPDTSIITNFILYWGSSSSDYWYATATSPHDQSSFKTGWNVLRFDWNGASSSGSPDSSAVNYLKFLVTYDGTAETDLRLDKITASLGKIYELEYYSNYMFQSSAGTWKEDANTGSDIINLDQLAYEIYVLECAMACVQQVKTQQARTDYELFYSDLYGDGNKKGLYGIYEEQHPSEAIKEQSFYWEDIYS